MAKQQGEPQKAPYVTPRIFKLEKLISPLAALEHKDEEETETGIGWVGYLGIVIGSIIGYFLAVLN